MRLTIFALGRILTRLSSINKSLHALVEVETQRLAIERERMTLDHPNWQRAKKPREPVNMGTVSVEELNKQWRAKNGDI